MALSSLRVAIAYLLLFIPAAILGIAATGGVIFGANAVHLKGLIAGWLLNVVPGVLVGLAAYSVCRPLLRKFTKEDFAPRGHLRRSAPLYGLAVALAAYIVTNWYEPGFWFYGQIFVGSWAVAVGGIVSDLITGRPREQRSGAA